MAPFPGATLQTTPPSAVASSFWVRPTLSVTLERARRTLWSPVLLEHPDANGDKAAIVAMARR
jgi:hypothetical protein